MINKVYEKIKQFFKNNYKFLIVIGIILFLFYFELPYIIYKRGGTINLDDRVIIDKEYKENGSLSMSYVTAVKGTPAFILLSFIMPDWDLIPLKEVITEGTYNDALEEGKIYLNEGIDNAIIAAFNETNYGINITKYINTVIYLSNDAKTDIKIGDEVISVDGNDINNLDDLKAYINSLEEGKIVKIKVSNNDKIYERNAEIYKDTDNSLKIGIAFKTTYEYETEIPVSIKMKKNESGSSGGLMMSLAIYNALTEEDITKGLNIVGTGSIASDGTVLEIGGVKYKVLAADKAKADIFFCPEENYEEAIKIKEKRNLDVKIVKVKNLKEAINYLHDYNK